MNIEQIKEVLTEFFSTKKEVLAIYLYGSFLKTPYYNDLDIGLLIEDEFKRDLFYETRFAVILEKKLKSNIDLRVLNDMPLRILNGILQNSKILYCRDELARIRFEARIMKEYIDLKPHHDFYEEMRGLKYATG